MNTHSNNDIASVAITSKKLAELLGRHLRELPEDAGRLAQRTCLDIVLEAAQVTSIVTKGRWRTYTFEDGDVIEERIVPWPFPEASGRMFNPSTRFELEPEDDGGKAVVAVQVLMGVVAKLISNTTNPRDFTVAIIMRLAARAGLEVTVRGQRDLGGRSG